MNKPTDLREQERAIARRTEQENPREVEIINLVIGHFHEVLEMLGSEMKVEPVRREMLLLATLAFNALRWSMDQIVTGYYGLAVGSARVAWECWLNGAYLNLYPEQLDAWKKRPPVPRVMRRCVADRSTKTPEERDAMLKAMDELYSGWERFISYSGLSHPTPEATDILVSPDGEMRLRLGPDYDGALLALAVSKFMSASQFAVTLVMLLLPEDQQAAALEAHERVDQELRLYTREYAQKAGIEIFTE